MRKQMKKWISSMLVTAMAVGMLVMPSVEVKAAESVAVTVKTIETSGENYTDRGQTATFLLPDGVDKSNIQTDGCVVNIDYYNPLNAVKDGWIQLSSGYTEIAEYTFVLTTANVNDGTEIEAQITVPIPNGWDGASATPDDGNVTVVGTTNSSVTLKCTFEVQDNFSYKSFNVEYKKSKNNQNSGQDDTKTSSSHTHSFSWQTISEATKDSDGRAQYRCSCGAVEGEQVISKTATTYTGLYKAFKNAKAGEAISYDSGEMYTFSDTMLEQLSQKKDVSATIDFKYKNKEYTLTIPAGMDYTKFFGDKEFFYGFLYFAQETAATVVEK